MAWSGARRVRAGRGGAGDAGRGEGRSRLTACAADHYRPPPASVVSGGSAAAVARAVACGRSFSRLSRSDKPDSSYLPSWTNQIDPLAVSRTNQTAPIVPPGQTRALAPSRTNQIDPLALSRTNQTLPIALSRAGKTAPSLSAARQPGQ